MNQVILDKDDYKYNYRNYEKSEGMGSRVDIVPSSALESFEDKQNEETKQESLEKRMLDIFLFIALKKDNYITYKLFKEGFKQEDIAELQHLSSKSGVNNRIKRALEKMNNYANEVKDYYNTQNEIFDMKMELRK